MSAQEAKLVAMPASIADIPCALNKDGVKLRTMMQPTLNNPQIAPASDTNPVSRHERRKLDPVFGHHRRLCRWSIGRGDQNQDQGGRYSRTEKRRWHRKGDRNPRQND